MSGTSLDGIDVALAYIQGDNDNTKLEYIDGLTLPWKEEVYNNIIKGLDLKTSNIELISKLNYQISYEYHRVLKELCKRNNIKMNKLDFIAIHGQTMWHDPNNKSTPSTLQLGSGSVLSALTNTTVISNFRVKDLVVEGQGAPLVPFVDKIIFNSDNRVISAHNLGGISNLTLLENNQIQLAYDTGPSNMMIDYFMKSLFNKQYDENGVVASKGKVIKPMYDEIMSLDFFKQPTPKSTGRELFGDSYSRKLFKKYKNYNKEDYVRTVTQVTIDSIVNEYKEIHKKYELEEIIFSGGGTHNKFALSEIKRNLPEIKISKSSDYNVSVDFKEALAFIVLGNQTYQRMTSDLRKATGSNKELIIGEISF